MKKVTVWKVEVGTSALTVSQADSKCQLKFTTVTMMIRFIPFNPYFLSSY